jgi:hypothetical protein
MPELRSQKPEHFLRFLKNLEFTHAKFLL